MIYVMIWVRSIRGNIKATYQYRIYLNNITYKVLSQLFGCVIKVRIDFMDKLSI